MVDEAPLIMLSLMNRWMLDDQINKQMTIEQYTADGSKDVCTLPLGVDWFNKRIRGEYECPDKLQDDWVTLRDHFKAVWEAVAADGEGCVTSRRLRDKMAENAATAKVVVGFAFVFDTLTLDELEEVEEQRRPKRLRRLKTAIWARLRRLKRLHWGPRAGTTTN